MTTKKSPSHRLILTLSAMLRGYPLKSNNRIIGAVELLKRFEDVARFAYQISDSQPSRAIDHILVASILFRKRKDSHYVQLRLPHSPSTRRNAPERALRSSYPLSQSAKIRTIHSGKLCSYSRGLTRLRAIWI